MAAVVAVCSTDGAKLYKWSAQTFKGSALGGKEIDKIYVLPPFSLWNKFRPDSGD